MKRTYIVVELVLLCFMSLYSMAFAGFIKDIKVGKYQTWVDDNTHQGETSNGDRGSMYQNAFWRSWPSCAVQFSGWYLGTANWTAEDGKVWPVKLTGAAPVTVNEANAQMPVEDEDGYFLRRYMRYQPPKITVDGHEIQDPFPLDGSDEVNPNIIPGTADIMVTSTINTDMGVTIQQKVLAWSQTNHDDYIIYDFTFTNTGNTDLDPEIELPNQTLQGVYFLRSSRLERWDSEFWYSGFGQYEEDTLRMQYAYPAKRKSDGAVDKTGNGYWDPQPGWLWNTQSVGQAVLHADASVDDPTDDFNQPKMTGTENSDLLWIRNDPTSTGSADWLLVYKVMTEGWQWRKFVPRLTAANNPHPELTPRPNSFHSVRMQDLAVPGVPYILDLPWVTYGAAYFWAAGPYTMKPGDNFRIVWADGFGVINPLKIWEITDAWEKGTCQPPPGMTFDQAAGVGLVDNMPPPYKNNPSLYNNNFNDWAKDAWIFTGIDSLIQNMSNAQWNVKNNFNVPVPPPPPSIEVTSLPNKIVVEWGNESESASDFAGYRLYRSEGFWYEGYLRGTNPNRRHGEWKLIRDFPGSATHSYDDTEVTRGVAYFYKVTAYDDGVGNGPDVDGGGKVLESGHFLNVTRRAASLTRNAAANLDNVVIVPNPYHIGASALQFPGQPNKIQFYELPPVCTIRIYTESGDLVKTIEHTNGSGDEAWGAVNNEHMTTETGQIVVSGLYIANIQTPDGQSVNRKFLIVR